MQFQPDFVLKCLPWKLISLLGWIICPRSGRNTNGIFSADEPLTNGASVHSEKTKQKKKRFYFYWFSFPEKEKTSSFQWHFSPFLLSKWIQTVTGFKCVVSETKWNDFFFPRWNFRIQFAIKFMIRDFRLSDRHHFAQERRSLRKCTLFNRT